MIVLVITMHKHLHIVAPKLPSPSDAGIANELFYMVKALHANEILIHLHCFEGGNNQGIAPFCKELHGYDKKQGHKGYSLTIPQHLSSRSSATLTQRLLMDDHPILFMGFQSIFPLLDDRLHPNRSVVVRMFRDEGNYFMDLAKMNPWGSQKLFFMAEAFRFRRIMHELAKPNVQLVTAVALDYVKAKPSYPKTHLISPIRGMPFVMQPEGLGNYCFFYGNLAEPENEFAAMWLLENVFDTLELPFVIAGDHPSPKLEKAAHQKMHTCLVANPSEKELQDLIKKAQVNLLPAFISQSETSNLHQALALGRQVITNTMGAWEKDINTCCHVVDTPEEFMGLTAALFSENIDQQQLDKRAFFLNEHYKNEKGIAALIKMLY